MRKKHGITPKIPRCSGPDSRNEQTPTLKMPLQTELRFHSRGYEQPPHRRACGTTNSGRLASDLCSSSDGPRTDAAAGRLSFASPLKGREPDIKAKEPEVDPRVALTVSSAEKLSPAATTSAPTAASTCPQTPHQRVPAAPKRTGRSSFPSSSRKREWDRPRTRVPPSRRTMCWETPPPPVRLATVAQTKDEMLHPGWAATVHLPRHGWRVPPPQGWRMVSTPRSWRKKRDAGPREGRPRLASPSTLARMMKILEAEGRAEAAARLASPHHQTDGHHLG
jgi:hypothetical protein